MWLALWIFVLCLVHIQFKYCNQVLFASLKIIETSLIVLAIQIYWNYDSSYEQFLDYIQSFPNFDNS